MIVPTNSLPLTPNQGLFLLCPCIPETWKPATIIIIRHFVMDDDHHIDRRVMLKQGFMIVSVEDRSCHFLS